jgi:ferritin-like metal-binding protein YciE
VRLADAFDRAGHALVRGSESLRRRRGEPVMRPPDAAPAPRPARPAVADARDLYLAGLAEALWTERHVAGTLLPRLIEGVADPELSGLLAAHLEVARGHGERVEGAFRAAGAQPRAERCLAVAGLSERHAELAAATREPPVGDVGHAVCALQAQLHSIAAHRALELQARALGLEEAADLLAANRREEEQALDALDPAISRLAEAAAHRSAASNQG